MFAVFCSRKHDGFGSPPPQLDPLDYGLADEPEPELLARRNRVGLFTTREQAESALRDLGVKCKGQKWLSKFAFVILECVNR